jgi:uncharacterized protein (UPF0147 family)
MADALHPKIGGQVIVVDGIKQDPNHPRLVAFTREALQHIWNVLHDLEQACEELDDDRRNATSD